MILAQSFVRDPMVSIEKRLLPNFEEPTYVHDEACVAGLATRSRSRQAKGRSIGFIASSSQSSWSSHDAALLSSHGPATDRQLLELIFFFRDAAM
eukprot:763376-Hanusia_phi.AAC.5